MVILSFFLCIVFLFLGLVHIHWALGGTWGYEKSLPANENGERILNPKKRDSAIVGLGLLFFSILYVFKSGITSITIPLWIWTYGSWLIPAIFLLRAIGDFKYVGFFKKVKHTVFGKADSKIFSPLCLLIAILAFLINFISQ
jgi:hypothetical protein